MIAKATRTSGLREHVAFLGPGRKDAEVRDLQAPPLHNSSFASNLSCFLLLDVSTFRCQQQCEAAFFFLSSSMDVTFAETNALCCFSERWQALGLSTDLNHQDS